jgi:hypothetical protein
MPADPIRPATRANSTNRKDWRCYGIALGLLCLFAVQAYAQCTESSSCQNPAFNLSAYYGGQNVKINKCIDSNSSSCAWADAVNASSTAAAAAYFLACSLPSNNNPIALCYYSGMPGGKYKTPSCTLSQNGNAAECYCYEISQNNPAQTDQEYTFSYVELTAILNEALYNQTVADCSISQGNNNCLSLADVLKGDYTSKPQAQHLCAALTSQPNGIFPGADLISDFSEVGNSTSNAGIPAPLKNAESCGPDPYAACMTAPCKHTNKIDPLTKLPLARCTCPIYNGPNQVGNPQIEGPPAYSCTPTAPYVWSSANINTN